MSEGYSKRLRECPPPPTYASACSRPVARGFGTRSRVLLYSTKFAFWCILNAKPHNSGKFVSVLGGWTLLLEGSVLSICVMSVGFTSRLSTVKLWSKHERNVFVWLYIFFACYDSLEKVFFALPAHNKSTVVHEVFCNIKWKWEKPTGFYAYVPAKVRGASELFTVLLYLGLWAIGCYKRRIRNIAWPKSSFCGNLILEAWSWRLLRLYMLVGFYGVSPSFLRMHKVPNVRWSASWGLRHHGKILIFALGVPLIEWSLYLISWASYIYRRIKTLGVHMQSHVGWLCGANVLLKI